MENRILTVKAINEYLSYKIASDINLKRIFIKGEISNVRCSKGHYYFVLKDDDSEISAIMFENYSKNLSFVPIDGMSVLIEGSINVYIKKGTYNINVFEMQETGLGEIYLKFLKLKEKLSKEGIFDSEKKLLIPHNIEKVGIITSATGEALQDILSTITKRYPLIEVFLYPSLVQGPEAPKSLIKSLKRAISDNLVDILIIGRGGGSIEDLSCFNDEELARLVAKSPIPTISAVGHEMDYTIIDFASSYRAPTPTAAATKVTPNNKQDLISDLDINIGRINSQIKRLLTEKFIKYDNIINSYGLKNFVNIVNSKEEYINNIIFNLKTLSPIQKIEKKTEYLDSLNHRLNIFDIHNKINAYTDKIDDYTKKMKYYFQINLKEKDAKLNELFEKIDLVNPSNILKKGYALVYQKDRIIKRSDSIIQKLEFEVKFYDSSLTAKKVR